SRPPPRATPFPSRRSSDLPAEKRLQLDYLGAEWLRTFGQPVGGTNQLTGQGIIKRIAGEQRIYDCFEPLFRQQLHLDWQVWADIDRKSTRLNSSHVKISYA